jgi:hypothetical protein
MALARDLFEKYIILDVLDLLNLSRNSKEMPNTQHLSFIISYLNPTSWLHPY